MIRLVTLDLWETLIADSPQQDALRTEYRIRETLKGLGDKCPRTGYQRVSDAHQEVWRVCSSHWATARDVSFKEQVRIFLNLIEDGLSGRLEPSVFETIAQSYARAVLEHPPRLIAGVPRALETMVNEGRSLGLICNTGRSPGRALRTLLDGFGILGFFSAALFSDETIVRKPDPAIFRKAAGEMGGQVLSAVHVGDSWENDVAGALSAGCRAVWISSGNSPRPECPAIESLAGLPRLLREMEEARP